MDAQTPQNSAGIRANAAITRFLEYYVHPDHPFDYAVMIDGPWGSGKTHLVKEFLKGSRVKPLYVTLNGVSSVEQIEQEFFRQLHPVLASRGMKIASAVVRAAAKGALKLDFSKEESGTWNIALPDIDLTKDLADPRNRLLIFDDLERCKMPVTEALGYINTFVEHDGLKAIILANEHEIVKNIEPRYGEIKEKLIGQTLRVSAPADEAFDVFLDQIGHAESKRFLTQHREDVLALHRQGGRGNLRTLKHAMWDFEKIGSQLQSRHWGKEAAILKLMKGVMAITMEHRAGELMEDELPRLVGNQLRRLMRSQVHKEMTKADEIEARYPQVDFDDVLLDSKMLGSVLLHGEMDRDALVAAIDATADFSLPGAQPLWFQATQVYSFDDATIDHITRQIEEAFSKREFTVRGELLHIVGIRLWFAEIGLIEKTAEEVVAESKVYIDDLKAAGRLEAEVGQDRSRLRDGVFGGYRVATADTQEYRGIAEYYEKAVRQTLEAQYPERAEELLGKLATDPDGFLFDLVINNVRSGPYWDKPVLAYLSPKKFAEAVFTAAPEIQSRAIETLNSRHHIQHFPSLRPELAWIEQVKTELETLMETAKPMTRYRLRSLISRNLDPLLGASDAGEVEETSAS